MKVDHVRDYVVQSLGYALNPRSIAVVGASQNPTKVGHKVVEELRDWGYQGELYPVNPKGEPILGLQTYRRLQDIPCDVDLAFISLPALKVEDALHDAVEKGCKVAVVSSSAFKEVGRGDLQDELTVYCREHKLPLIGPNLVGLGNPYRSFNCGFLPYLPLKGPVGMISQSGSNLLAALGTSQREHYGISFFVGLGNKADVDFSEFVAYADQDPNTKCIAMYMEGLDSPEAFEEACSKTHKPVVVLKVGRSQIGAKAAMAHTASENNASTPGFCDQLFRRCGVLRATTWQEFLDMSLALGHYPSGLKGDHVVMITNGGGSGILSCDHFERKGMPLCELREMSPTLVEKMREAMPSFGSPLNPVDISGTATPEMYEKAFTCAMEDPNVHGILGSICPTAVTNVPAITDAAIRVYEAHKDQGKAFIMECQGGQECQEAIIRLRDHGIPAYATAEQAVNGMVALYDYSKILAEKQSR